jgi:hypothetical protein
MSSFYAPPVIDLKEQAKNLMIQKKISDFCTFQEILAIFTTKSHSKFSSEMLKLVFVESGLDLHAQVTVEDFFLKLSEFECKIRRLIEVIRQEVKENSLKLTNVRRELIEAKANKSPEDNNLLTVMLKEAQLKSEAWVTARVIYGDWEVTSNKSKGIWNESFTFNTSESDLLTIEIWQSGQETLEKKIGKVEISLNPLKNEEVSDKELKVFPNNLLVDKIAVRLHWVSNKVSYLERQVKEIEGKLEEVKKKLKENEYNHITLLSPFVPEKDLNHEIDAEISKGIDKFFIEQVGKQFKWTLAFWVLMYSFLLLIFLGIFKRHEILNVRKRQVTVFCLLFACETCRKNLRTSPRAVLSFVMASQVVDFFELILFPLLYETKIQIWWRAGLFLGINLKLVLCVVFWKVYFR